VQHRQQQLQADKNAYYRNVNFAGDKAMTQNPSLINAAKDGSNKNVPVIN